MVLFEQVFAYKERRGGVDFIVKNVSIALLLVVEICSLRL